MDFGVDDTAFDDFMRLLDTLKDEQNYRVGEVTWNWLESFSNI